MASTEIAHDFSPLLVVYKDGRVHRLAGNELVDPSLDPLTDVESKDVVISPETAVSVRIYRPKPTAQPHKLPLLIYFHGGCFCIESAFSTTYNRHLNSLVAEANVIAVSVDYRLAPEHPLPIAYEDSWDALKWVAAHSAGTGPEEWLNGIADLERVYFAGDSAGANIANRMAIRVGSEGSSGLNLRGLLLVHPYFWGGKLIGDEEKLNPKDRMFIEKLWYFVYPKISGLDDPIVNPEFDPELGRVAAERVAVYVAEKDAVKNRGWLYSECLQKSGWSGTVDVVETKGQGHVFHLFNPTSDEAVDFIGKLAAFINAGHRE
ncbi:probable carboxylesterase 2 [Benincasa hispida]|uniref:probable carboxylesterase 2 n=1 Tax=Benincasa hispida TaxID=102211 RepID=UPI001900C27C|nr:probable carboxylesterase 2 [Benincasa hispida]